MKGFIDFIPVLFFFISYIFYTEISIDYIHIVNDFFNISLDTNKSSAIYFATLILMITYSIQFITLFFLRGLKKIHYITLLIILIAGLSTLYFKNPVFIKIKPSIVYWGFGVFFIFNYFFGKEVIIKKMLKDQIMLEDKHWKTLTLSWAIFFILCGFLNLYVAEFYAEESWVEFKFYILGIALPIAFIILNGIYIGLKAKK